MKYKFMLFSPGFLRSPVSWVQFSLGLVPALWARRWLSPGVPLEFALFMAHGLCWGKPLQLWGVK